MTAKQYLQLYKKYENRYFILAEQIKALENEITSLKSPNFDERVQTSPKKDPIGEMVCNLEKEKAKLSLKMTECTSNKLIIKNQVNYFEEINDDYYTVLLLRYILYKDWKFICDKLSLSRTQANVIHGRALQDFDLKFKEYYEKK